VEVGIEWLGLAQAERDQARQERDQLRARTQLSAIAPAQPQPAVSQGPIKWQDLLLDPNITNGSLRRFMIYGESVSPTEIKNAYITSNITGEKVEFTLLRHNEHHDEEFQPLDTIEIDRDASILLVARLSRGLSAHEFFERWGNLTVEITYNDHENYKRTFDETFIRHKLREYGIEIGGRVRTKNEEQP
jgi:hypothetical protein